MDGINPFLGPDKVLRNIEKGAAFDVKQPLVLHAIPPPPFKLTHDDYYYRTSMVNEDLTQLSLMNAVDIVFYCMGESVTHSHDKEKEE